ncbi:MAG: MFS transporter [Thermoplasmataceae archaeon]|jgi:MFS family permease
MESRYTVRGLNRRIYYIGLTRLIRSTGRSSTFIFMPLVLIEVYNLSFLLAGALLGVATLIMAIVQLYSGRLTDRLGRRFFMVLVPIPNVLFFFLMFLSVLRHFSSIVLVGSWFASVIVNALQFPALQASVADMSTPEDRMSAYTMVRIMVNTGTAIGPLLGGFLATIGFEYIFLVASIATIVEIFILYLAVPETYSPQAESASAYSQKGLKSTLGNRFFLSFVLVGILFMFFYRQQGVSLSVYAIVLSKLPLIDLGYLYAINGLLVVLLQFRILKLMTSRWSPLVWRGVGVLFYAGAFLVLAISPAFIIIIIFMIISTMGENFTSPTTQTIVTLIAPVDKRGTYIGAYSFYTSFGSFTGSVLGLLLLSYLRGITPLFWVLVSIGTFVIAILYMFLDRSFRPQFASGLTAT